jgi:hypothetical protein
MKGKVNCTCGWSWDKSDSSAKDMYICHECGRDNSNNMKNGGWLDNYGKQANYNDSKATASPDMVGDGFSNVGRNYSPAWGGQFEEGGEIPNAQKGKKLKPITTNDPADPRLHKYLDSLNLYKGYELSKKYNKQGEYSFPNAPKGKVKYSKSNTLPHKSYEEYLKFSNEYDKRFKKAYDKGGMNAVNADSFLSSKQGRQTSFSKKEDLYKYDPAAKALIDQYEKLSFKEPVETGYWKTPDLYHPTIRDIGSYYKGAFNPIFKKPNQEVIYSGNPKDVEKLRQKPYIAGVTNPKIQKQVILQKPIQAIENNLQPIGIQNDFNIEADIPQLRQQVRQPKYYDIQENINQPFGGSQTNYRTSDLNSITSPDDLGPGNTRNITPVYQTGGSLPGSVGFTYARTKGIPSNGPYAKKTLASAQNGASIPVIEDIGDFKEGVWVPDLKAMAKEAKRLGVKKVKTKHGAVLHFNDNWEVISADDNPTAQNGVDMYNNPITADLKYDQSVNRTNYNPRTNQMIFGNDMPYFVSQEKIDKTLAHENRHAWQFANDRTNFNIVHNPEYAFQDRLKKKPESPSTEEVFENYHNRKQREVEIDVKNFKSNYPELSFMPDSLIYKKFVDPLQYNNPSSVEGEAQFYQETGQQFQNGGEMQYYQNGLDFKPKSISRDGGWLNKYDVAQDGKKQFKLKDEREDAYTVRDNIQPLSLKQKRGNELLIKETEKARKDKQELNTTGQIKNPRSIRYKKLAPKQSDLKTQTKSNEELEGQLGSLEKPLIYLASPEKLLGDLGIPGMETSELDRQAIMANRFNPNQTRLDRFINNANIGLGYVPDAAINTAMAAAFMPEGSGALGLVNEALNPLAGINSGLLKNISKSRSVNELKGSLVGIPPERTLPRLSPEELKIYRQVQDIGRMRSTGKPISEQYKYALEQGIPEEHLQKIFNKSKSEIESAIPSVQEQEAFRIANPIRDRINLQRPPRRSSQVTPEEDMQLDDSYLQMPESLRARIQAVDSQRNATQTSDSLDDMFAQLDAGIHSSQTAPRRTSTSDQMIDVMNSSPEEISNFAASSGMTEEELINLARSTMPTQSRSDVIRHSLSDYGSDSDIEQLLERVGGNQLPPIPEELIINTGQIQRRTLPENLNAKTADIQRNININSNKFKNKIIASSQNYPVYEGPVLENVPSLSLSSSGSLKNVSDKVAGQSVSNINSNDVFTGSLNTSHSSYLPQLKQLFKYKEGAPQFLGYKPMNHMGFLSDFNYSADDIAKYLNTEIDEQIKRGVIPKNISRPYSTNKPNASYQNVNLPHYGIKQFQEGGIIKDDMGQWKYPGEITEIGSNQITMEGVPYDVLGISDTGDTKLMKPGKDYKFKGKKVTEFPMAKNGRRQEQKGLVNLDDLLNFTNYNKPQPGGWLNKYN